MQDFLVVYPVYLVIEETSQGGKPLFAERVEDQEKGLAVFTEEMLAERCRDSHTPHADVIAMKDEAELAPILEFYSQHNGMNHVAVDPYSAEGMPAAWIRSEQIIQGGK